eukprot:TRINITY_DN3094_c0_g1_i1.p2 TRINITY_DN3094_c0_g1~~TRINITY_DN3094_c0_g1_i1.p2  ORF type:complete len:105 (+),score=2.55 TRINITY_DN3094_c0_g1_i1:95-409(+)
MANIAHPMSIVLGIDCCRILNYQKRMLMKWIVTAPSTESERAINTFIQDGTTGASRRGVTAMMTFPLTNRGSVQRNLSEKIVRMYAVTIDAFRRYCGWADNPSL